MLLTGNLSLENRSIIAICRDCEFWILFVGVSNHLEQALALSHAINGPVGIELLVPTVLRVDLSKHE